MSNFIVMGQIVWPRFPNGIVPMLSGVCEIHDGATPSLIFKVKSKKRAFFEILRVDANDICVGR